MAVSSLTYAVGALLILLSGVTGFVLGFVAGRRSKEEKDGPVHEAGWLSEEHRRHHEKHHSWEP